MQRIFTGRGAMALGASAFALAAGAFALAPSTPAAETTFASQTEQGHAAYASDCAACHGTGMDNGAFAPALKGPSFQAKWGGAGADKLYDYIRSSMPPGNTGGLPDETYAAIVAAILAENGVSTTVYYPLALHLQPVFRYLGYREGSLPVSESLTRKVVSLPIFPEMTEQEQNFVIAKIQEFYTNKRGSR